MNSTFWPRRFSRYFTSGANLRICSDAASSGIVVTLKTTCSPAVAAQPAKKRLSEMHRLANQRNRATFIDGFPEDVGAVKVHVWQQKSKTAATGWTGHGGEIRGKSRRAAPA